MATQWLRRTWLVATCASALLLAACGGGSIDSQLTPTRVVAFGDAMGDVGQTGSRYTVNDGTINIWTQFVANSFSRPLTPASSGGTGYATGNARVAAKPDAAGDAATPTVREQIGTFLAGNRLGNDDLVLVSAGTSDVITQVQAVIAGTQSEEQMLTAVGQAGRDLAGEVRRLTTAGATHVVVVGPYNMGRSPWAIETNRAGLLERASSRFNDQLLVALVDLGDKVLYVDAALYFNLLTSNPGNEGFDNGTGYVCTSRDPGPGIGTGAGQVNSRLCTTTTLGGNYTKFIFADRVYPTSRANQLFGDYAQKRIRERW